MKTNNLRLIEEFWDEAKTKLWREYNVDQFGRRQGKYKSWHENGQPFWICTYKNGRLYGKHESFNRDETRNYIDTNHIKKILHGTKIKFDYQNK